jgi:hypothetical protein
MRWLPQSLDILFLDVESYCASQQPLSNLGMLGCHSLIKEGDNVTGSRIVGIPSATK